MNRPLSPLHIKLLLHCHTSPETYTPWSDTARDYIREMEDAGALVLREEALTTYKTTPLGDAWVRMILNTPPPRIAFIDAHGEEVL